MKPLYGDWKLEVPGSCLQAGEVVGKEELFHFKQNAGNQNENYIQLSEVADIVAGTPLYDTIYRADKFALWTYTGQCVPGGTVNRNPMIAPVCYVCSRFRADTEEDAIINVEVAKWACKKVMEMGMIPIAPHLYFPRFVNDNNPADRYFGMGAGKRLMELCNTFCIVTVDGRISEGMDEEIQYMNETLLLTGMHYKLTRADAEKIVRDRLER